MNGILSGVSTPKVRAQTFLSKLLKNDTDVVIMNDLSQANILTEE